MKKKLLWIDHEFHKKTKSTLFLEQLLESEFEISKIYLKENNQKLSLKDFTRKDDLYFDVVLLFQLFPERQSMDLLISYKKGIFIPMIDGYPSFHDSFWSEYRDFEILSFCRYLNELIKNYGITDTEYIQYFPNPKEIKNWGSLKECFFWKRRGEINLQTIEKVLGEKISIVQLNKSKDPGVLDFVGTSKQYKILEVPWFHDHALVDRKIQESKFYFAPREFEGIGQAFLNAMNLGRIVVAPDNPTMNEYIKDGETGFLYNLHNPQEISFENKSLLRIQENIKSYMNEGYKSWLNKTPGLKDWIASEKEDYLTNRKLVIDVGIFRYFNQPGSGRTGIYKACERIMRYLLLNSHLTILFYSDAGYLEEVKKAVNALFGDLISEPVILTESSNFFEIDGFLSLYSNFPKVVLEQKYIKKFCIVNDCIPVLKFREYGENFPWFFELMSQLPLASRIFTISNYTKTDLLRFFPEIDEERVKVCYLGDPLEEIEASSSREDIYRQLGLSYNDKYCLSVCSLEPRKNLQIVIESFFKFIEIYDLHDIKLVLAGPKWSNFENSLPKALIKKIQKSDSIIFTGYISDEVLKSLYKYALFFVYTSRYEGFGLPLLEAMNSSTPVVCSNTTSIPEVVGDSAVTISPLSIEEHVEAFRKLYFDSNLRSSLKEQGRDRARSFTWENCSKQILKFIEEDLLLPENFPTITVVMVTLNLIKNGRKESFRRAIDSIKYQKYPTKIEIVVIDGSSTDGTLEILNEYKEKALIDVLVSEPDKGLYDAMNKGIDIANGDLICFLNSDDYYHHKLGLFTSAKRICLNNLDYSFADALVIDMVNHAKIIWKGSLSALPLGEHYCHQTMICKKEMLKRMKGFDCSYNISSDSDLCIRAVAEGYKGMNVGINFVTYSAGLGLSSDSRVVRDEHSKAFYNHIGRKLGLSRLDCFNLWNLKGLLGHKEGDVIKILLKLKNPEWVEYCLFTFKQRTHYNGADAFSPGQKLGRKIAIFTDLMLKKPWCNKLARRTYRLLKPFYIKSKPFIKKFLIK